MIRTFKYRLCPTVAQASELEAQLGEAARLYNAALQERRDAWQVQRKHIGFYEQDAQLKEIRSAGDLGIPSFKVARDVLRRVDLAFRAFYRRAKAGQTPGYPRFRSARRYDSLTFEGRTHWIVAGRVVLFGVGHVKLKLHRPLEGTVKTVTVKRNAGRWFVCFVNEVDAQPFPATGATVGVDVGLASFAVLSSGETIGNPRYFANGQAKLRVAHRRVARRIRGSRGRRKAVRLLQRVAGHIQQQRRDFHHKVARSVVNRFDLIAVEDLNVKGLAGGMLAKSVHDAGWGQFLRLLAEKAESAARVMVAVDPCGTSQRCSGCGEAVRKPLSQRWHECACGISLSRDENAARNILGAGMALVGLTWPDVRASVPTEADRPQSTPLGKRRSGGNP